MVTGAEASVKQKPLCSSITDDLCNQLWDAKHQGNLSAFDGEIMLGRSKKSRLVNLSTLTDLRALITAESSLPEDLKKQAAPLIARLSMILKSESETIQWARQYHRWETLWNQMLSDVAQDRAIKKSPELRKTRLADRTQIENSLINREYYQLVDQITLAKYDKHPHWLRVKKFFEGIKKDLISEVTEFPFAEDFKNFLIARVQRVELTLPFQDLETFDGRKDCAESTINAYYHPSYNKITVCAGLFNSLKSESAIYIILAHELSHSVDPSSYNLAWLKENGPRTKVLRPLIGVKNKPLTCDQWNKMVTELEVAKIEKVKKALPFDSLADCLDEGRPLKKAFDPMEVSRKIEEDIVDSMDFLSNRNLFSSMVIPNYEEFGREKKNPFFLDPDVFASEMSSKGYTPNNKKTRSHPATAEIFYQAIRCEHEAKKSEVPITEYFTKKSLGEREQVFRSSIETTQHVLVLLLEEIYYSCGQYCPAFVRNGMARNIDEKFADWMSFRLFQRFLKTKSKLEEKREASALALADLCDRPSVRQEAGTLLNIEKSYSIAPHPESRMRRLALYNREISNLLECIPETKETWGSCSMTQGKL
ncbi:MAG: hypothetical protein RJB66_413 [Pseudomonadota bacterium]|jgi:hypothetical protein